MVEVLGQAPEAVADEADSDEAENEDERDGLADGGGDAGTVEAHGQGRAHEPDGEGERLPQAQLTWCFVGHEAGSRGTRSSGAGCPP